MSEPNSNRSLRRFALSIFATVFFFNMLTTSRERAWGDSHGMWEVAVNIVTKQSVDIGFRWPEDIPAGRNGKYYGIAPMLPSLVHVPGVLLNSAVDRWAKSNIGLIQPLAVHLAPSALGAAACALLFLLCVQLGLKQRTASCTAAITAVATSTWVYAHYPYSEIVQLCCFTFLILQTMRLCESAERKHAIWFGIAAGLLLNSKYVFAISILGAAATVAWSHRKDRRQLVTMIVWAAVGGLPFVALALWYNWVRWGDVTASGYEAYLGAFFGGSIFDGAWGMLLSANKSAFLYSPPLLLAAFGLPIAWRARPDFGRALLLCLLPVFLIYCSYRSWSGDYAWGPRFFVWTIPVLCVGVGFFIEYAMAHWRRRVAIAVIAAVVAGGITVQILGNALYWDHFIRISIATKNQWLGNPNRAGSYIKEAGRGHCDSCFEDTYQITWTPAFQPIKGHYWLLGSVLADDDWQTAIEDAPWRRYSTLPINLADTYPRARIDWWVQLWRHDFPDKRNLGIAIFMVLLAGAGISGRAWVRRHKL
jgi:hypothetical protein